MERKLTIKSKPSGARLYTDYIHRGRTPVEIDFSHYGTRHVRLEKSGYQTKITTVDLSPSWYSYFPINFFTEVLLPFTIVDHRTREITMKPYRVPAQKEGSTGPDKRERMLKRAEELRRTHPQTSSDDVSTPKDE